MPDALSRLTTVKQRDISQDNELDNIYNFSELYVSDEFKEELRQGYKKDARFARVSRILRFPDDLSTGDFRPKGYGLNFVVGGGLLYYLPYSGPPRLCIPASCTKTLLELVYNQNHFGFDRTYEELRHFYIPRLIKAVTEYIAYYQSCLVNATLRQRPNGSLYLISTNPILFYIIIIDFIVALLSIPAVTPWSIAEYDIFNAILTVTYKGSKRSLLIPGHDTYTAEN
jgi:hypothetical protein